MTLECANKSAGEKLQWFKQDIPIHKALAGNEDLIKLDNETGTLEVLKISEAVYGNYTCKGTNYTTKYGIVRKYNLKILILKGFNPFYNTKPAFLLLFSF